MHWRQVTGKMIEAFMLYLPFFVLTTIWIFVHGVCGLPIVKGETIHAMCKEIYQ